MSGLAQDARQAMVADDEPDAATGEVLLGVVGVADGHDVLVAEPQLVDGAQAEVIQPADDGVARDAHPRSLRGPVERAARPYDGGGPICSWRSMRGC